MLRYNGLQNHRSFKPTVPYTKKASSMLHSARYNLKETITNQEKDNTKIKSLNQVHEKQIQELQKELKTYKEKYQYLGKKYTELETGFRDMYDKNKKDTKLHEERNAQRDLLIKKQHMELNKLLNQKKPSKSKAVKKQRQDTSSSDDNSDSGNNTDDSETEYTKPYKQKRKSTKAKKLNNTNELRSYFA